MKTRRNLKLLKSSESATPDTAKSYFRSGLIEQEKLCSGAALTKRLDQARYNRYILRTQG